MKRIVLSLFLLAGFLRAQPADTLRLNLDQAIALALKNNRDIRIAALNVRKARAAVAEAFGYALPSLDFTAGFTHFIEKPRMPFPDFGAMLNNATYGVLFKEGLLPYDPNKFLPIRFKLQTFARANNYQAEAKITQILFNSAVFRGIGASEIYLNMSKENLKAAIAKTIFDVKKAFYGVLLTERLQAIARERLRNAQAHLQNIKAMRAQGLLSDFVELQATVQVENIRPILSQLKNAHTDALNGLKIVLNIDQNTPLKIKGDLRYAPEPLPELKDLIAQAKNHNFSIRTLHIKNQLDDELTAVDRGGYWPTLAAFGDYTYTGTGEGWDFQNYTSATIGISLSINLFQGGRTHHKVQQDQIAAKQTLEQIHTLTDAIQMQVISKVNDLKRVQQQISAMQRNVDLAQRAYEIAEHRYKVGEGSELEVKDANLALNNARTNYAQAVHDYLVARAALDNLLGNIKPEYLAPFEKYLKE